MAERKTLIDEDELHYEGLFNYLDFYTLINNYITMKGYDKTEVKNEEIVTPDGKTINLLLLGIYYIPSDYVRKVLKMEIKVSELKTVETEVDKVKVQINQGKIHIKFSAIMDSDYEGRWDQKSIYRFLRTLFEHYVYRKEMKEYEDEIISDMLELREKIGEYLNLNRYRKAI